MYELTPIHTAPESAAWDALTPEQKREQEPTAGVEIHGKRDAAPVVEQATRTPKRDAYQRNLRVAIYSLIEAAKLNVNEEHALLSVVAEIKNIAA